jgi:hypothetical protein
MTPDLLTEAQRLMPGLEWHYEPAKPHRYDYDSCRWCFAQGETVTAGRDTVPLDPRDPWCFVEHYPDHREDPEHYRAEFVLRGIRWAGTSATVEGALLYLRTEVERYLRGRNRPSQRREDCKRWLAAWRTP